VFEEDFQFMTGYTAYLNNETNQRRKTILTRDTIELTAIEELPSGKGIAAKYDQTLFVNAYAHQEA
jgi:hypothetical protein